MEVKLLIKQNKLKYLMLVMQEYRKIVNGVANRNVVEWSDKKGKGSWVIKRYKYKYKGSSIKLF